MQQARRPPTRITHATRLLLLRPSSPATPVPPWPQSDCSPLMLHRIRIRLRHVQPVKGWTNVAGETIAEETVMGLPTRFDCRQQLQCGQRCRSLSLVCAADAQDVCAITHLKSPWPIYPSLSVLSSSHRRRSSGQIRCSSYSSVWKRSAPSANASVDSGGTQTIEQLWEEYFADASQWWDNRVDKRNLRSPDLKHKVTRKALWIDGWSTPAWVKARLQPVTQGRLQCGDGHDTINFKGIAQGQRLRMGNNGEGITRSTSVRGWRQIVQGGGVRMQVQSARTTSEAIAILKNRAQQGIAIDSYTYVDVVKRCSKQKDLVAAKQVHDCIIKSGMEQNTYVGNSLLSVYIRCGRLQDARRVFDGLLKKDVISWNVMIGGYAKGSHAHDAMEVFYQMREENVEADEITYLSILKACANPSALKWGKEVHVYIRHGALESNVRVGTALLQMYAKCGCIKEARQTFDSMTNADVFSWNVMIGAHVESGSIHDARLVFDRMEDRNVITWNVMIGAYAKSGCGEEAYRLFLQMKREGWKQDAFTYTSMLNACATAGTLEWVKEVHGHVLEAGLESDLPVGNALIHMYAKCGSIDDARLVFDRMVDRDVITWTAMIGAYVESGSIHDARLVFDRMEERNVVTWTVMIGAYAESGCGEEAYRLFLQMKREGLKPDAITYISILNACASAGALEWVKEVHGHALEAGLELDLRVGNALVHMYSKCGSINDARLVFDRMEERDVITWNVMIGAYADIGCGEEAYGLFLQMKWEGLKPDAITCICILNTCASAGALEWVKEVHCHALEAGLESDLRVGNALIHMYAKCGSIADARLVFDRMIKRDVITSTVMIGAFVEFGSIHDARRVFDRMDERDVITWTVMIRAYAESGCCEEAYRLFLKMKRAGLNPDAITYRSILNACASAGALEWMKELHGHALEAGLECDLRVGHALIHMYAKCGSIDDARLVFDRMDKRDVVTWNVMIGAYVESGSIHDARLVFDRMEERDVITWNRMIGAYAKSGSGEEAYRLFLQMKREGFNPDAITYISILNACASAGALEWVKEVHGHALEAGLESDVRVGNALIHMYARCGSVDDARQVFDRMEKRDLITWNVMVGGLAQHGCGHEALEKFRNVNGDGIIPDRLTLVAVLSACSHAGLLDDARRLFLAMTRDYGIKPDIVLCNCMVDLLGRAGHLEEAMLFIGNMPVEPDGATWGALLGACRTHGNVEMAEHAAAERLKLEPSHAGTYVLLSNIYAAAGMWDQVSVVRTMMQERGIRKEPGRSWIEVDNKIHRFVVGDTSHPETKEIYAELNRLTERIKAEGYVPDTRLVLQNVDEEDKELALCSHSEKLAIAYGLMRTRHGSPIRVYKNLRVCSDCHTATKFISKVTGREIVARDANRFHHFKDGVCSCGDYW